MQCNQMRRKNQNLLILKGKVHNISPQNFKPRQANFTRIDSVMNLICHLGLVLFLRRTVAS